MTFQRVELITSNFICLATTPVQAALLHYNRLLAIFTLNRPVCVMTLSYSMTAVIHSSETEWVKAPPSVFVSTAMDCASNALQVLV